MDTADSGESTETVIYQYVYYNNQKMLITVLVCPPENIHMYSTCAYQAYTSIEIILHKGPLMFNKLH